MSSADGTNAPQLQEELDEIAPFKGSYHLEAGHGNDDEDDGGIDGEKKQDEVEDQDFF